MISRQDLRKIARARLRDSEILLAHDRFDVALYLSGYVVELALKARICKHLRWAGYPDTNKEFDRLQSFRTHDLETLLRFTGIGARVNERHLFEWSTLLKWNPELRYKPIGSASKSDAEEMIRAASILLRVIR